MAKTYVAPAQKLPRTPAQAVNAVLAKVKSGEGGWSGQCERLVRVTDGIPYGKYDSAKLHGDDVPTKYRHTGSTIPLGAHCFWGPSAKNPYGHIARTVGNGLIATNDTKTGGKVSVVSFGLISASWHLPFRFWAPPYYRGYKAAAEQPPAPQVPVISLAKVVYAAKHDPTAPQGHSTYPGAVTIVEHALMAEGLLSSIYARDGAYGSKTVDAYSKWQRKLGYTGKDADGIPGATSLKALATKHGFKISA